MSLITEPLSILYDWKSDIMSKRWNSEVALKKLNTQPLTLICDALLDQNIFAGSGNIIKNETLFRAKIHPNSVLGKIPSQKKKDLVTELIKYSKQFLKWRRENTLKRHWMAYAKKICPRDHIPFRTKHLGKTKRRTFFCAECQKLYL